MSVTTILPGMSSSARSVSPSLGPSRQESLVAARHRVADVAGERHADVLQRQDVFRQLHAVERGPPDGSAEVLDRVGPEALDREGQPGQPALRPANPTVRIGTSTQKAADADPGADVPEGVRRQQGAERQRDLGPPF